MLAFIEKTYGFFFKYTLSAVNPFKKIVIRTECRIHKLINIQALTILKNDGFEDAYSFFSDHIFQINQGAVWADQDFKSSGHFYNPVKKRGLFGNKNALSLAVEYYTKALNCWHSNDTDKSMFFLGAAAHIVQDMTVPQHANIRLLNSHRQFESFIQRNYLYSTKFIANRGGYYMNRIEEFVKCNARVAIKIFLKLKDIENSEKRFYTISKFILPLAQKSTAGCFMRFYKDVSSNKNRHNV
jgi:phospholipase C